MISACASGRAVADDSKPVVAVVVVGTGLPSKGADRTAKAVRSALSRTADLTLLAADDEEQIFRAPRPKPPYTKKDLALARKYLEEAAAAMSAVDFGAAVKSVNRAATALQPMVGLRVAAELDREYLLLAITIAHAQRDEARLDQLLKDFIIRFPGATPGQSVWPPDVQKRLKTAIDVPSSVLNIRVLPGGMVYVDGREIGPSPVRLGALPAGPHRVEIEAPGYGPYEQRIETEKGKEAIVDVRLVSMLSGELSKVSASDGVDPSLLSNIRTQAPGLSTLVLAGVEGEVLVLRRVDLAPALPPGATSVARTSALDDETIGVGVSQLFHLVASADSAEPRTLSTWAWVTGGVGAAALGVGITLRVMAASTESDFNARLGALTQTQAYELRDRSVLQSRSGLVCLGVGLAAIAGATTWVAFDLL